MMEPLSFIVGKKAIDSAIGKVENLVKEAGAKERRSAERCARFLEAANVIVQGLEEEYDQILVQAETCGAAEAEITALKTRISDYLTVDRLRGKLIDVIEALEHHKNGLRESASSVLNWPWKRADKARAIAQFTETLDQLTAYLHKLSAEDLPSRPAESGVGQAAMHEILKYIAAPPAFRQSSLCEIVARFRAERDKEPMFEKIRSIR